MDVAAANLRESTGQVTKMSFAARSSDGGGGGLLRGEEDIAASPSPADFAFSFEATPSLKGSTQFRGMSHSGMLIAAPREVRPPQYQEIL